MVDDDAAHLLAVYRDAETMRFLSPPEDLPTDLAGALAWVRAKMALHEQHGLSLWSVVDRVSRAVVGDAGLQLERAGSREVGIGGRLNRTYWRRGYATEVGTAPLRTGFEQAGLERIVAVTRPDNLAARAAAERLGMTLQAETDYFGADQGPWVV